ncbi:MAG TPA: molybdenum cofactor guanylyltransferase [Pyrinomonadaceae bacterium]|jgi:molybdopterin-guanine dinucleotide biosynthesis protein A|nr:molybdenum cofactor guanylyltransferase [Pyrinomonadaceae bacterium]
MDQFEAFILAGGASSRMGVDKSQLLIGAESLTQHIANTLFNVTPLVTLVGHTAEDTRLKTATDVYPQWGALGGLHGALHACKTEWAFIVACDLPFISAELITHLASERKDYEAVVPIQPDDRPQPLCALYRVEPCLQRATELIQKGRRRPLDLLETVKTRWVSFSKLDELPESQNFFVNINTPEDYYEAIQKSAVHKNLSGR